MAITLFALSVLIAVLKKYRSLNELYLVIAASAILMRSFERSMVALTNVYEVLLLMAFLIALYNGLCRLKKIDPFHPVVLIIMSGSFYLPIVNQTVTEVSGALRTPLLPIHVMLTVLGIVLLMIAGVLSLKHLLNPLGRKFGKIHKLAKVGYLLWISGALLLGMIYAELSWGRFWGWDVKETWSLLVTIYYGVYFHLFKIKNDKIRHIMLLVGFILIVFNLIGINYLFTGLHSYR